MPRRNRRQPVRAKSDGGELYLCHLIAEQERDTRDAAERDSDVETVDNDDEASFLFVKTKRTASIPTRGPRQSPRSISMTRADKSTQFTHFKGLTNLASAAESSGARNGNVAPEVGSRSSQGLSGNLTHSSGRGGSQNQCAGSDLSTGLPTPHTAASLSSGENSGSRLSPADEQPSPGYLTQSGRRGRGGEKQHSIYPSCDAV